MIKGLPRESFVSEAIFREENERVFSNHWLALVRADQLPQSEEGTGALPYRTVRFGDLDVILVRRPDGQVRAFHNVCRHRGTRLLERETGELRNGCITCPYHAWSYDSDGALIGAPNMTDVESFDRSDFPLFELACHVWAGLVFVHQKSQNASFVNDLGPLLERLAAWQVDTLRHVKTLHYDVAANWKLIFQNYSECYHCPTVHPDLNQQTPYKTASNDLVQGPVLGGPMQLADGFETVSSDGKFVGSPFPGLDDRQRSSVFYYTVFPNMFVSAHPDYVMIHRLRPVDCGHTAVECHFLASPESSEATLARAWQMWDQVNRQDWNVCELTQAGARSPAFQPGPYSGLESMLAAFDQHYRSEMSARSSGQPGTSKGNGNNSCQSQ